jgi:tRNA A-37 threonylcarbamoyl transferase component Bud32
MSGRIGRYEILDELGQGATAVVYRARDSQIGRVVALKTLRPDLAVPRETRERFVQEAKAAGQLAHPAIVAIHDVLEVDGAPCIVMECVEGRSLAELVAPGRPLEPARARRLIGQVCEAVAYAHARGVLHRDIKASNVLVTADGAAKLGDFGIARLPGSHLTQTGALLGTPAYMAPEVIRGRPGDARSDVFSLGVVLYEVLTGTNPFLKEDLAATLYEIVHADPVPAHERNPAVPPELSAVVETALAKDPARRYESARALADALAGGPRPTAEPRRARAAAGPAPRRWTRPAAGLLAGAVLVAAGGWAAHRAWSPSPRPAAALPAPVPARAAIAPPAAAPGEARTPPPAAAPGPRPARPAVAPAAAPAREPLARPDRPEPRVAAPAPAPAPPPARPAPAPPAARPPAAESGPTGPATAPAGRTGAIVVRTNPGVEVFLDGAFRAASGGQPLLLADVPLGEHRLTLRLDGRERTVRGTVAWDSPWSVTHYFDGEAARAGRPRRADEVARDVEGLAREAGDRILGAVEDSLRFLRRPRRDE